MSHFAAEGKALSSYGPLESFLPLKKKKFPVDCGEVRIFNVE